MKNLASRNNTMETLTFLKHCMDIQYTICTCSCWNSHIVYYYLHIRTSYAQCNTKQHIWCIKCMKSPESSHRIFHFDRRLFWSFWSFHIHYTSSTCCMWKWSNPRNYDTHLNRWFNEMGWRPQRTHESYTRFRISNLSLSNLLSSP